MLNYSNRYLLIVFGFLMVTVLPAPIDAPAGFLLGTAQYFPTQLEMPLDMDAGDLNNDTVPDVATLFTWDRVMRVRFGLGNGAFGEATVFDLDGDAQLVRCGDLDNDGDNDLVLFSVGDNDWTDNFLTVYINDGGGQLSPDWRLTLAPGNYELTDGALADLNSDGNLDLATQNDYSGLLIFLGAGDGTFAVSGSDRGTGGEAAIIASDLDRDTHLDLVTAFGTGTGPQQGKINVHYNLGNGTFEPEVTYLSDHQLFDIDAGDLDGDGNIDLVAVGGQEGDGGVAIYRSRGDRTFMDPLYYEEPFNRIQGVALDDRTGNGILDAVLWASREWADGDIYTLPGNGDATFGDSDTHRLGSYLSRAELLDLDGDGVKDFLGVEDHNYQQGVVVVLMSRASGDFANPWMTVLGEGVSAPRYCADADFNNDGITDLAVANTSPYVLTMLGNGNGSYQPYSTHLMVGYGYGTAAADLDRDGNTDLLATCTFDTAGYLCLYPGNGNGTFGDLVTIDLGMKAYHVETAHLDGDNFIDVMLSSTTAGCQVLHGNGAGGLTPDPPIGFTDGHIRATLGDIDEDGDLDLAMVFSYPDSILLAPNNGSGTFSNSGSLAVDPFPSDLALGDFNGDGHLDLATANNITREGSRGGGQSSGTLYFGNGDGSFDLGPDFPISVNPWHLETADMDGDGLDDLLVATIPESGEPMAICLLRSSGTGFPGPPDLYNAGEDPSFAHLFDADRDGDQDVAVSSLGYEGQIWVLLNSSGGLYLAAGPGKGESNPSEVRTFDPLTGDLRGSWPAYGVDRWGVNVALGELTGSGLPEVVTGAGPGAVFGPHVRGFSSSGAPLPGVSYLAYGTNKWGVNVACGDLDNDGFDEIVTGAGPGAVFGPHVRGWNWDGAGAPTSIPGISYFAYGTPKWGVNVSCGDIDGDGYDEIVTGAGPGAVYGPHVRGWNCDGGGATSIPGVSFLAYGTNKYGVNVACGDIDGDGIDEMVTGAGPGAVFGPHVRGWNWDGTGVTQAIPGVSYFAYNGYTQWGVNVSCGDLDNDGIDEILTGPGPGETHTPRVRGWNYDGQALTAMGDVDFLAFDQAVVTHGVKVAGN